ncbi:MAG: hypothetical protein ACYTGG_05980, partial [Planctomycetota bacterium]
MITDPFQHFLGVSEPDDPLALLGLSAEAARDPDRIEAALFRRTMETFQKKDGHGPEAERVRWRLRAVAEMLKDPGAAERLVRRKIQLGVVEDALQRMLGLGGSVDPFTLLGLPPRPADAASIEAALLRRLGMTYSHAASRSDEAEAARNLLRAAARSLKNREYQDKVLAGLRSREPAAIEPARNGPRSSVGGGRPLRLELTQFDRQALAILVGCGGWNHASRGRLVGLASTYGVTVSGLMKVIVGLSNYAKSGGPRLGAAEITRGQDQLDALPMPARLRVEPDRMERLVAALDEKFSRAFAEDSAAARIRLSIGFSLLTLVALIVTVWLMLTSRPAEPEVTPTTPPAGAVAGPADGVTTPPAATSDERPHVLRFPVPPSFSSRGLPVEAINAADGCAVLPSDLDDILRRLTVS